MIVIVDDRDIVTEGYRSSFDREGIPATGFSSLDFQGWVGGVADDDLCAINAFLIGECSHSENIARIIKRKSAAAVIAMRDQKSLSATLEMFAGGVDDVVTKPCHVREILARIEAISRRTRVNRSAPGDLPDIKIFRDGREPVVGGNPMSLPRRELRILEYLVANNSRRVTKSQIFSTVYGLFNQGVEECVIESHISKLRKRLRQRLSYDPIDSKRHLGYRLTERSAIAE